MRRKGPAIPYNDYSGKMPHLNFQYDETYRPTSDQLPDPQVEPVLVGARVPIRKVGIAPVDLPIRVLRRDGTEQVLQAKASLYCSLDDPNAKGLNLSRLYLLMHDKIKDHLTIEGIRDALRELADKQGSANAYCKLRFLYPWTQKSLRSMDANGKPLEGHIAYNVEIEGRYHKGRGEKLTGKKGLAHDYRFFMHVDYIYSSTCPCSFELAKTAEEQRKAAANAHSQRSKLGVTIEFDPTDPLAPTIEDVVELCRTTIPTEVQVVVKRVDEQAFAELNGSNLVFSEDVCRLMYEALAEWASGKGGWRISDFNLVVSHEESLHPWNAIAVTSYHDPIESDQPLQ